MKKKSKKTEEISVDNEVLGDIVSLHKDIMHKLADTYKTHNLLDTNAIFTVYCLAVLTANKEKTSTYVMNYVDELKKNEPNKKRK